MVFFKIDVILTATLQFRCQHLHFVTRFIWTLHHAGHRRRSSARSPRAETLRTGLTGPRKPWAEILASGKGSDFIVGTLGFLQQILKSI